MSSVERHRWGACGRAPPAWFPTRTVDRQGAPEAAAEAPAEPEAAAEPEAEPKFKLAPVDVGLTLSRLSRALRLTHVAKANDRRYNGRIGAVWLLIPGGMIVGLALLGFWVFNHEAPRIAEDL